MCAYMISLCIYCRVKLLASSISGPVADEKKFPKRGKNRTTGDNCFRLPSRCNLQASHLVFIVDGERRAQAEPIGVDGI